MLDLDFNYQSAVGKLNYVAQTTRPDIMYATHQITKYSSDPRKSHGEAILYLVRYLKKTRDYGLKFKRQVALSTTEAEYIAMSQALCDVIPVMNLIQEICGKGFKVVCTEPYVYCKVFEDNSGALELARLPKLCPRTKRINVC